MHDVADQCNRSGPDSYTMIYLLGWFTLYLSWFVQSATRYRGRFFLLFCLLVFGGISFFRADVGTDTASYESMFLDFINEYQWNGREPAFDLLALFLSGVMPSVEIAVRAVSLVFFGFLVWFLYRSDNNERILLLLYLLPVFAYQYSMNTLRAGLAFSFILLATQELRQGKEKSAIIFGLSGVFFHYSAIISITYIFLSIRSWFKFLNIFWAAIILMLVGTAYIFNQDYFLSKFALYTEYVAPSPLSGLSIVFPLALILVGVLFGRLPKKEKIKLFVLGFLGISSSWLLIRFSYAGLRFLDLFAYAVPLSVLMAYARCRLSFDRVLIGSLFLAGVLSSAAAYYRFTADYTVGSSPWLPYQTWLQLF